MTKIPDSGNAAMNIRRFGKRLVTGNNLPGHIGGPYV